MKSDFLETLDAIAKILDKYDLCEISYQEGENSFHIVRKYEALAPIQQFAPTPSPQMPEVFTESVTQKVASPAAATPSPANEEIITSPIVGTVYLSPEPGAPPFITPGTKVSKGKTLMIVEAMKVMNPIKSPIDGIVKEILVSDAKPVEFGEALVKIVKE